MSCYQFELLKNKKLQKDERDDSKSEKPEKSVKEDKEETLSEGSDKVESSEHP